jgi:glutamate dehydrogenase
MALESARPLEALLERLPQGNLNGFAKAFFSEALPDELTDLSGDDAAGLLNLVDSVRSQRAACSAVVRIDSLSRSAGSGRRMAIIIINDDMPFLVDSISAELVDQGLTIHRLFHPILDVTRDADGVLVSTLGARATVAAAPGVLRESVMYIEVDRVGARERLALTHALETILGQVRACVADWRAMVDAVRRTAAQLKSSPPPLAPHELAEHIAFIDWLAADQMTLLGYGYFPNDSAAQPGLGLLRNPEFPLWRSADGYTARPTELAAFLDGPEALLITKANAFSMVHRRVHLDYVGVKAYDAEGRAVGEHRIVGLFTSSAYAANPREVPILRRKVGAVIQACGYDPKSHAGKALVHVLETFPRDELFQADQATVHATVLGLLSLLERPRPKLFIRTDRFERFVSVLACVPRDSYRADIRQKTADMLVKAFKGRLSRFSVELGDGDLARVQFIIATTPGQIPHVDPADLDRKLQALVRGWGQQLENALGDTVGSLRAARLALTYGKAFSAAYQEQFDALDAAQDIDRIAKLKTPADRDVRLYRHDDDAANRLRVKIYRAGEVIPLAEMVPVLEHAGLKAIEEYPYDLADGRLGWVHDFLVESADGAAIDLPNVEERLTELLIALFLGRHEDDAFNSLVLRAGLDALQVVWLRALFRYSRQTGSTYGLDTVQAALARYPEITRALIDLFIARHDPSGATAKYETSVLRTIDEGLANVTALDDDRILRQYLAVIKAVVRTNAFVPGGPEALAFKIRSRDIPGLPLPVPFMEIFVYSPRVEGIHLRGGKVARGGLRWSDRRDDFRTEILGLIKAQMVKNAVIVPVGAKGGFYPKQLPPASDRDAWLAEGTESYKIYIRALLSITDNLHEGAVVPPAHVKRLDEDDPYLVVAADKGTATFSDVANGIALDHGFWLGDAFASGGSNGYDHKKMGITAKGAWVAVERHFREMGLNVATDTTRVIGVGDMSGDVFGNGLLRSDACKLVAAFDHRHIFLDPDPDPKVSFSERLRMFALPRSSWADYDSSLLSAGGGIFPRSAKSVPLSPQVQALLGVTANEMTPADLVQAILTAEADLLWLGGIGTYIKAAAETHAQVGDKANDALRVDAEALRVKVIGEGANLGITQKGRIAFALRGGRLNTDFIDNSAGVDCSDNEVNIKILLNPLVQQGKLKQDARDTLLEAMTDDVGALVLRDNYLQTQALSMAEADAAAQLTAHARLIQTLEKVGGLNRAVEGLPSDTEISERGKAHKGLTRPELAVLLAYAKMTLYDALLDSDVPDSPALLGDLVAAFPTALQERFAQAIPQHRLSRDIVATKLANAVVNRGGLTLAFDLADATGAPLAKVCAAFALIRDLFDLRSVWRMIDGYDYQIPAALQLELQVRSASILRGQMLRLLGYDTDWSDLGQLSSRLKPGVTALLAGPLASTDLAAPWDNVAARGAPAEAVSLLARLDAADAAVPISAIAWRLKQPETALFESFRATSEQLGLDWLGAAVEGFAPRDPWERLAVATLASDLLEAQLAFTERGQSNADATRLTGLIAELKAQTTLTLPMLTHAVSTARAALAVS